MNQNRETPPPVWPGPEEGDEEEYFYDESYNPYECPECGCEAEDGHCPLCGKHIQQ